MDYSKHSRGQLAPCFEVRNEVARKLAGEIRKHGYTVEINQRYDKASFSRIFIKNTSPVELLPLADNFEAIV